MRLMTSGFIRAPACPSKLEPPALFSYASRMVSTAASSRSGVLTGAVQSKHDNKSDRAA